MLAEQHTETKRKQRLFNRALMRFMLGTSKNKEAWSIWHDSTGAKYKATVYMIKWDPIRPMFAYAIEKVE